MVARTISTEAMTVVNNRGCDCTRDRVTVVASKWQKARLIKQKIKNPSLTKIKIGTYQLISQTAKSYIGFPE